MALKNWMKMLEVDCSAFHSFQNLVGLLWYVNTVFLRLAAKSLLESRSGISIG